MDCEKQAFETSMLSKSNFVQQLQLYLDYFSPAKQLKPLIVRAFHNDWFQQILTPTRT